MSNVTTLPVRGEVFADDRGDGRTLRVNWHPDAGKHGLVILSLWRDGTCVCTFRLRSDDVLLLVETLTRGSGSVPVAPPTSTGYDQGMDQAPPTFAPSWVPPSDQPPPNTPGAGSWSA
jgi:hypothetical protein